MTERPSGKDSTQNDLGVAETSTEETLKPKGEPASEKNAAAVMLGRLGGLKGGKARAAKLTESRRREIASNAARKRWHKKD